jgi:hypothetical protein
VLLLTIAVMRSTFYSGLRAEDDIPVAMTIPTQERSHLRQLQVAFLLPNGLKYGIVLLSRKQEEITD